MTPDELRTKARIDAEGRDVTDLPGLWDESDIFPEETMTMTTDELRTKARRCLQWLTTEWEAEVRPPAIRDLCDVLEAVAKDPKPDETIHEKPVNPAPALARLRLAAERERCAKIVEDTPTETWGAADIDDATNALTLAAARIRALSEVPS